MNDILENYELRKKDLTFEIWNIEGVQYNFKLEDFEKLLEINNDNLLLFKKYLVYLDIYRVNYPIAYTKEDAINNFIEVIKDDKNKDILLEFFLKHENLFCDKNEIRRLKFVPSEYNKRIFRGI